MDIVFLGGVEIERVFEDSSPGIDQNMNDIHTT
jgi:hypothetical protein